MVLVAVVVVVDDEFNERVFGAETSDVRSWEVDASQSSKLSFSQELETEQTAEKKR